jgi:hypothetical protein
MALQVRDHEGGGFSDTGASAKQENQIVTRKELLKKQLSIAAALAFWQGAALPSAAAHCNNLQGHVEKIEPKRPLPYRSIASGRDRRRGHESQALEIPKCAPLLGVTTKAFWRLMERRGIPGEAALQLLERNGGLTRTGGRPRFILDAEQVRGWTICGTSGPWRSCSAKPFLGCNSEPARSLSAAARGTAGLAEVHRFLTRWAMSQALGS